MRVDFYVLAEGDELMPFACDLIARAYHQQSLIYIHTNNESEAHAIDEMLWTYKNNSFIPHHLIGEGPTIAAPVQIGFTEDKPQHVETLVNLSTAIHHMAHRFKHIIEFVPVQENLRAQARERFSIYKSRGCTIQTHQPKDKVPA